MSQLQTTCPHCHKSLQVNESLLGRMARCPACQERFSVTAVAFGGKTSKASGLEATQTRDGSASGAAPTNGGGPRGKPDTGPTMGRIGRFELKQVLGQGGFGKVYRAHDPVLDRQVALKVPRFGSDDAQRLRRFLAEAKAAARMRHPNIVAVFESGQIDGQAFIAAEFVEGEPLSARLAKGRPDFATAVAWVAELAEALHYAHGEGVVHRDIKPQNIMLGRHDRPQLMDFGLAKRMDEDSSMTAEGSLLGTPAYMSPEQARGETDKVGPASDQYSLGVVLYELLTGQKPFDGPPHSVIAAAASREPPAPTSLNGEIPGDLEAICQKAMSKDVVARYPTAGALADDLRRWLRHEETLARPIGRLERLRRWTRRNPVVAALVLAVAAALLLGAGVSSYFAVAAGREARDALQARGRADDKAREAQESAELARRNADLAAQRAATLERQLYIDRVNRALGEFAQNNWASACRLLDECPEHLRGWEWRYVYGLCHLDFTSIPGPILPRVGRYTYGREHCTAFTPDGASLVWQGADRRLCLWDPATGQPIRAFGGYDGVVLSVAFSRDGQLLAAGCDDFVVRVWHVESGELRHSLKLLDEVPAIDVLGIDSVAFIRDGAALFAATQKVFAVWELPEGRLLQKRDLAVKDFTFSTVVAPNEREIAVSVNAPRVHFVEIDSGRLVRTVTTPDEMSVYTAFSPDGRLAATAGKEQTSLWDVQTGHVVQSLPGLGHIGKRLAFSSDGRRLVSGSEDSTARIWDLATGRQQTVLRGHGDIVNCVVFSPDGRRVASAGQDGLLKIWDATRDRAEVVFRHSNAVVNGAWLQDGRRVSTVFSGQLIFWDDGVAQPRETVSLSRGYWFPVAWSPDFRDFVYAGKRHLSICDALTGQETQKLFENGEQVLGLEYSPDGSRLFVLAANELVVLDGRTRERIGAVPVPAQPLTNSRFQRLACDRAGTRVAVADEARITLLNLKRAASVYVVKLDQPPAMAVPPVCFSPDDRQLLHADGSDILVRDSTSGDVIRRLQGHASGINDIQFSPDGSRIATAGEDRTVKFWDPVTGDEVFTLRGGFVWLSFSPDGDRLLAGGFDRTARIWDATPVSRDTRPGTPFP